MTQIQSVISRVFGSVSKPGLSNGFHVWELRGEADLCGFALSESSWHRRKDSWKPNSSLTQKHTDALDELPDGSTRVRSRVSPVRKWVTLYSPIHPQTFPPLLHPESLVAKGWNSYFNLSTQLFNPHFKRRRHPAIRSATERITDSVSLLLI